MTESNTTAGASPPSNTLVPTASVQANLSQTQSDNTPQATKPRVTIRAATRPSPEPIGKALVEGGLITQAEADEAGLSPREQSRTGERQDRRKKKHDNRPYRRQDAPFRDNLRLAPPKETKPLDPLDVMDETGYTPRMRAWMADPWFRPLVDILSHQRPKGSKRETDMIAKHIYPLAEEVEGIAMTEDVKGNIVVDIGDNSAGVLWSCHTDTVHAATEQMMQDVVITPNGYLALRNKNHSCLGADDGAGVWIMIQMIRARVPGRYVFHYGEEMGCIGSRYILSDEPWVLEGMRYAIAFDRAGTQDVITHQRGDRCCSNLFVDSIVPMLPGNYSGCRGVFTDTAIYTDVIPECTNLSVGYNSQHSGYEVLYLPHIFALRDAMLTFDASRLVVGRDPVKERAEREAERAQRAEEERIRQQTWSATFRGKTGSASSTPSGATPEFAAWEARPTFLKWIDKVDAATVMRYAMKFSWAMLNMNERKILQEAIEPASPAITKMRFDLAREWLETYKMTTAHTFHDPYHDEDAENQEPAPQESSLGRHDNLMPDEPDSLIELIKDYPEEVADILEQEGFDVGSFWNRILAVIR